MLLLFLICSVSAQNEKTVGNDPVRKNWPEGFVQTEIQSSADGHIQKAFFHQTTKSAPQPLIISLHTWSGDYSQEDPLTGEILLRDWNYIHPDFRGSNTKAEACGSELVISDIEDAIRFAVTHGNVDTTQVHLIGVSGGGFATLLAFMKLNYPVRSFNAWASISNLEDWYWECKGRGLKYAGNLERVTTNGHGLDPADARKRSPLFMDFQPEKRKGASLNLYAGIHDGYTGSVPVSQSIHMYNKLVDEMYPERKAEKISDSLACLLAIKQINPAADSHQQIGGREIQLSRELPNLSFTLFEGTHEMLVPQALALIDRKEGDAGHGLHILTIGDSNGTFLFSWTQQLKKLMPFSTVVNRSVAGNTIGFDNLDREELNTLKNINRYLEEASAELGEGKTFDDIVINLGTNDTKRVFEKRQKEVYANFEKLIVMIRSWMKEHNQAVPHICWVSPSPMDETKANVEKYGGGDQRIQTNNKKFRKTAAQIGIDFLDSYSVLKPGFSGKTSDGVHLTDKGQFQLAGVIAEWLKEH